MNEGYATLNNDREADLDSFINMCTSNHPSTTVPGSGSGTKCNKFGVNLLDQWEANSRRGICRTKDELLFTIRKPKQRCENRFWHVIERFCLSLEYQSRHRLYDRFLPILCKLFDHPDHWIIDAPRE
jgi:hypothetical protein